MTMPAAAPALSLTEDERKSLDRLARSTSARHRTVQQAKALLLAGDGVANYEIARRVGCKRQLGAGKAGPLRRQASGRLWHHRPRAGTQVVAGRGHGGSGGARHPARHPRRRLHSLDDALYGSRHGIGKDSSSHPEQTTSKPWLAKSLR